MKRFCHWLLPVFIALALTIFTFYRIDGFSLAKIQGPFAPGTVSLPDAEALNSLKQPFTYLAKGRQCFVFESADGQTVIKFLNYSRFSLPKVLKMIPLSHYWKMWLLNLEDRRRLRFAATCESYQLAMQFLRKETGLIYLHFQNEGNLPMIDILDRAKRKHRIDLNQTVFILQKKATPIYEELDHRFQTGGEAAVYDGIQAFVSFLQKRCALHLADDDRDVEINFGFYRGDIMLLDPGRLFLDPELSHPERMARELMIASKRFRKWLDESHPASVQFLDRQIAKASL